MSDISSSRESTNFVRAVLWAAVYAAMLVPMLLFVVSLLGRYFFLCELIGNFRAYILAMLLPCVVVLWFTGKRKRALLFGAAAVWSCFGVLTPVLPYSQPPRGDDVVKIMSFNVWAINREYDAVLKRIEQHDPDVVTVLEYANEWATVMKRLDKTYPYRLQQPRWHGFGIAIFSKRPLSNSFATQLTEGVTDNPMLAVDVEIGGSAVRLAGVHLLSPMNRNRLKIRNRQLEEIADHLEKRDIPTIVMGDFNCTPWSPFLSGFLNRLDLRDSRSGFGYQGSWNATHPFLLIPIDHAFVSPEIHVHSRMLGDYAGSDHYPLVFEVSLSDQ